MKTLQKWEIKQKIREGESVECCGLVLYPILVKHYEIFDVCKSAWQLRMSTLPARYFTMNFLSAVFALELDSAKEPDAPRAGLLNKVLTLFCLSLRIESDNGSYDFGKMLRVKQDGNGFTLVGLRVKQDDREVDISAKQFSDIIRPLIAEQNGFELPDEDENPEIVQANEDRKKLLAGNVKLDFSFDAILSSVAAQMRVRERDLLNWTVRELEYTRRAISRDKRYMLCGQAEMSGWASFKDGNPAPSWEFDRIDDTYGTISSEQLAKKYGNFALKE